MHIDRLERIWIIAVAGMLGVFTAAVLTSVLVFGIRLPSPVGRVNPQQLDATEFARPGLRDQGGGQYLAYIVAEMWRFDLGQGAGKPAEIRVPLGAEVTFALTSKDVTHGFFIEEHNANLMVLPGQIGEVTVNFRRPGTYHIICHEYCGPGHQTMVATIIVA
jgi:cytochrome c oxidase subunit II